MPRCAAVRLRPHGRHAPPTRSMSHASGQPPEAPHRCHASCSHRPAQAVPTHAARGAAVCGHSSLRHPPLRSQHHHQPRPPLLKLRTARAATLRAAALLPTASAPPLPASASSASHRPLASLVHCLGLFVLRLGPQSSDERKRGSWALWPFVVPAALASRHPVKTLGDEVCMDAVLVHRPNF